MKISVIVPCYNEEDALPRFMEALGRIRRELDDISFEIILVDDGSRDGTRALASSFCNEDTEVRALSFSRNFGKEAALLAGLQAATGDLVTVMDADLQDPPELLCRMLTVMRDTGCDCVAARRTTREGEPVIRSFFARSFYRLMARLSTVPIEDGVRDFRLMTRQMTDAILSLPETRRFSKGLFVWVGFDVRYIDYQNVERVAGSPKWSFWGLLRYALEGMFSFSTLPLSGSFVLAVLSLLAALTLFVAGLPIAGAICAVSAAVFGCVGLVGQYVTRIYWDVKRRPIYVVKERE